MDPDDETRGDMKLRHLGSADAMSRRSLLQGASVGAGVLAGVPAAFAETAPLTGFGAPLVEIQVPAGALTVEQKGAMIRGVTDVLLHVANLPPNQATRL